MFVQSAIEVPFGVDAVRVEMLASVRSWLQPLLEEAVVEGRVLLADVIPRQAADLIPRQAAGGEVLNVTIGSACVGELMVSIPYRAWIGGQPWADFDSHLAAGWFGDRHTQLHLDAHYDPPPTTEPRERLLLHELVQAMCRELLAKVALELSERVCTVGRLASRTVF